MNVINNFEGYLVIAQLKLKKPKITNGPLYISKNTTFALDIQKANEVNLKKNKSDINEYSLFQFNTIDSLRTWMELFNFKFEDYPIM